MADIIDLTNEDSDTEDTNRVVSDSRAAPALSVAARQQLLTAITTCPEDRLRDIVAELVIGVPACQHAIFNMLVTRKPNNDDTDEEEDASGSNDASNEGPLVSRWELCGRCSEEEFDAGTRRVAGECLHHPGELEVDCDKFVDWDEDCHGPMDTKSNRRQFPENFTWNCCREDGTIDGCVKGKHVPGGSKKKRARHH